MSTSEEKHAKAGAPVKPQPVWIYTIILVSDHRENDSTREEVMYVSLDLEETKIVYDMVTSADFVEIEEFAPRTKNIVRSPAKGEFFREGACNGFLVESDRVVDDNAQHGYCTFFDAREPTEEELREFDKPSLVGHISMYLTDLGLNGNEDTFELVNTLLLKVAKNLVEGKVEHVQPREGHVDISSLSISTFVGLAENDPQLPPIGATLTELLVTLTKKAVQCLQGTQRLVKTEHIREAIRNEATLTRYFGEYV